MYALSLVESLLVSVVLRIGLIFDSSVSGLADGFNGVTSGVAANKSSC